METVFERANKELERMGIPTEVNGVAIMFRAKFAEGVLKITNLIPPTEKQYEYALGYAQTETFNWIQKRLAAQP
jgi:hypothetical protein